MKFTLGLGVDHGGLMRCGSDARLRFATARLYLVNLDTRASGQSVAVYRRRTDTGLFKVWVLLADN